mmetsp:Transcript_77505/g.116500  ORF Transcript_77505/g.116500 Transcript_77505/m.116500 type:complete len:750 (-) Transcript_77505:356-2605(-)|eukprot:CAMPEP_0117011834 /NCGR_PEP_ID=MMETSP0472-20121206/10094_1 /TAXON_ID=693140 ORGANISM="Tiarina fusus, Strain LIS" /NCGR_SAMPLE_ID=MMETSP0472 /ASSEMBLY_ACC=CAM_ASM_000603 /LENGTH=749 /DNA_ID=CAMNT_0004714759 /DNA_START=127 /DNA_END=2376 /DNA_ORIENTATION=-
MEIRHNPRRVRSKKPFAILASVVAFSLMFLAAYVVTNQRDNGHSQSWSTTQTSPLAGTPLSSGTRSKVFYPISAQQTADKLQQDLRNCALADPIPLDIQNPPDFLSSCPGVSERLKAVLSPSSQQPHLAMELLKYCALSLHAGSVYIDSESPLMVSLDLLLAKRRNVAILNDSFLPRTIHGSFLWVQDTSVAKDMLNILVTTSLRVLESSPLLLPKSLYDLLAARAGVGKLSAGPNDDWYLWQHSCTVDPLGGRQVTAPISNYALQSYRLTQNCPEPNGFCCSIFDPIEHTPIMVTKHLLLPYQILPRANNLPKPLNAEAGHYEEEDLPFISTISEQIRPRPVDPVISPNFFEILLQNDCLPSDKQCSDCLRDKKGAKCKKCATVCPCYCKTLCHVPVEEKFISKELTVRPPLYARDPSRLIPRIVHQTWFEDVTPEKYPNMSRLIESFKQSGWEYKFYTDDEAGNFLSTHFPPEIRQAYDALRPGAFKADLFRYCVLLIHGGVYADMDIMLEANLDLAVGPDVGFMVPQDEPGTPVNHRMCLWNGFIAAAPGHPFLAKVIETVVNNVRNRFTSVDVDNLFCPDPELSILHAFDTLFTAGPCILGAMVNKVLGRHGQTPFAAGEMDIWEASKAAAVEKGTEFVIGVDDKPSSRIPGRTIILHQNKWDMGAHRFTLLDKNVVVAATDLPDSDDRANQEKPPEHYSKTHVKAGIYGLDRLYVDNVKANEELRFFVDGKWDSKRSEVEQSLS